VAVQEIPPASMPLAHAGRALPVMTVATSASYGR